MNKKSSLEKIQKEWSGNGINKPFIEFVYDYSEAQAKRVHRWWLLAFLISIILYVVILDYQKRSFDKEVEDYFLETTIKLKE